MIAETSSPRFSPFCFLSYIKHHADIGLKGNGFRVLLLSARAEQALERVLFKRCSLGESVRTAGVLCNGDSGLLFAHLSKY